jgi:hypothetical protein
MPRKIRKIALAMSKPPAGDWKNRPPARSARAILPKKLLNPQWPELQGRPTTLLKL